MLMDSIPGADSASTTTTTSAPDNALAIVPKEIYRLATETDIDLGNFYYVFLVCLFGYLLGLVTTVCLYECCPCFRMVRFVIRFTVGTFRRTVCCLVRVCRSRFRSSEDDDDISDEDSMSGVGPDGRYIDPRPGRRNKRTVETQGPNTYLRNGRFDYNKAFFDPPYNADHSVGFRVVKEHDD